MKSTTSLSAKLSFQTIRKYGDQAKIKCYKTPSGHRRFNKQDLERLCGCTHDDNQVPKIEKKNFIYTRVSSKNQLDDLSRQVAYIEQRRTPEEYASFTTLKDIASGIDFKRKGLQTILDACLQGTIGEVVIAHRDRLSRFGFELIEIIVDKAGGKITILDDEQNQSAANSEQELAEDLLSIIHIYSCRQMGTRRSYKTKQQQQQQSCTTVEITKDQDKTVETAEEHN